MIGCFEANFESNPPSLVQRPENMAFDQGSLDNKTSSMTGGLVVGLQKNSPAVQKENENDLEKHRL